MSWPAKQMFMGLEVTERTILLLPGSYSGFKSACSQIRDPWELHTFYCFLTASSKWILCKRLTLSVTHLGIVWVTTSSDHRYTFRKHVKHKIKQALPWGLRVQLDSYKAGIRWSQYLQQLEWGCLEADFKCIIFFFQILTILSLLEDKIVCPGNKKCCFLVILFCCKLRYCTNSPVKLCPSTHFTPVMVTLQS